MVSLNSLRSGFEKSLAKDLKKRKVKFTYETETFEYILVNNYTPDFFITNKSGKKIIVEAKGKLDKNTRRKMLAVKAQHPEVDIRIVFMNSRVKLYRGSKTTYGQWATKYGFTWADKHVPKEWTNE